MLRMTAFKYGLAGLLLLGILSNVRAALRTNDEYNRTRVATRLFDGCDSNKDKKFTPEDSKNWKEYASADANNDQEITAEEFLDSFQVRRPDYAKLKSNVVYKTVDTQDLLIDLYYPLDTQYDKAPVFFYIHGGGWAGGAKELGGHATPLFKSLLEQGIVCVSVDYRLVRIRQRTGEELSIMRDCAIDCRDALRFLKKHQDALGIDADKVVLWGMSAGAHLASLITWTGPDDFRGEENLFKFKVKPVAAISWYGVVDFREERLFVVPEGVKPYNVPGYWAKRISYTRGDFYPNMDTRTQKRAEEVSPIFYANKKSAPLLHIHGTKDAVISVRQADHLKKQTKDNSLPAEVIYVEGAGHGFYGETRSDIIKKTVNFTLKYLQESAGTAPHPTKDIGIDYPKGPN